jgi:mono/diheme cytochrome c family protein
MTMNSLRHGLLPGTLLAGLLMLPLGAAAQQGTHDQHQRHGEHTAHDTPEPHGDHGAHGGHTGHGDHGGHAGHAMGPTVTRGAWSYLDRDNPDPSPEGRWVMVPMPGVKAGFQFVRNVDESEVCAGLDEHRVMVDRATREACRRAPDRLPFDGVARTAEAGGHGAHPDHGGHEGHGGVPAPAPANPGEHGGHDHRSHGDHGSHAGHDPQAHSDYGSHAGHDHPMHGDHGSHAGHDHQVHGSHVGGHAWRAPREAVAMANPVHADRESIRRGRTAYQAFCLSCHGATGRGNGQAAGRLAAPPADLVAHGSHHTDGDLAWKIRTGNGAMPAFEDVLTDRHVWDVVNYLRTLAPGEQTARRHNP